jgi:ATP-dependent RNA helicase HelY
LRFDVNQVSVPTKNVRDVLIKIETVYYDLDKKERDLGFTLLRPIDAGFAIAVFDWLNGEPISSILEDSDLSPGDFVRWIKQVMDLSNQLISADIDSSLKKQCYQLRDALDYGIVNASEMDLADTKSI